MMDEYVGEDTLSQYCRRRGRARRTASIAKRGDYEGGETKGKSLRTPTKMSNNVESVTPKNGGERRNGRDMH